MRRSIRTLAATAVLALSAPAAAAAPVVHDEINVGRPLFEQLFDTPTSIGWFYTPTATFSLSGVLTRFHKDPLAAVADVTVEVLDASLDLGDPLATGTFSSADAVDQLGGATFAPITLTAGTTYFIGFRNVLGLGLNVTADPAARQLAGGIRAGFAGDADPYGTPLGADEVEPMFVQPVLQLVGPPAVSAVPEPASVALVATGLAGIGVAARRRARRRI